MEENNLMEEVSFKELFYTIKDKAWLIAGTTIGALLISIIISFFLITPEYEASTTLMFSNPEDLEEAAQEIVETPETGEVIEIEVVEEDVVDEDYRNVLKNEKLMPTYVQLTKSRLVGENVIKNLNLDITYKDYKEKVKVDIVSDTYFVDILAKDKNSQISADIANEVAKESIEAAKSKFGVESIEIIDEAKAPKEPFKPRKLLNILIGTSLGIIVGLFITFLLKNLENN